LETATPAAANNVALADIDAYNQHIAWDYEEASVEVSRAAHARSLFTDRTATPPPDRSWRRGEAKSQDSDREAAGTWRAGQPLRREANRQSGSAESASVAGAAVGAGAGFDHGDPYVGTDVGVAHISPSGELGACFPALAWHVAT